VWLACVGLTDHYLQERISEQDYEVLHRELESFVRKENDATAAVAAAAATGAATPLLNHTSRNGAGGGAMVLSSDGSTMVPVAEDGKLSCEPEPRFILQKHWSLYDAM